MEPFTVAAAAAAMMKYLLPTIRDIGEKVLDTSEDAASNAVVGFGRTLLHSLLPKRALADLPRQDVAVLRKAIERRVLALAQDPTQEKAASQLEGAIEELLIVDSESFASIVAMLRDPPPEAVHQARRSSYVGGDNSGTIITGDSNTVMNRGKS